MNKASDALERALANLEANLRNRPKAQSKEKEETTNTSLPPYALANTRLPESTEQMRAVPNGFLRSALFGISRKRTYISGGILSSLGNIEIQYKGETLNQDDLDVYESILHSTKDRGLASKLQVSSYRLLKLTGKTDTGKNRKRLEERIKRLVACALTIKQDQYTYIGSLVSEAIKDEKTQNWLIALNPKLLSLFAPDQFTRVDWEIRKLLSGKLLAQWLHGFYASHTNPFPIKISTLHSLCGSTIQNQRSFKQTLINSLEDLSRAYKENQKEFSFKIENDLVFIEKTESLSQLRHQRKKL